MMQGPMFKGDQSGFTVTPRIAIRIALLGGVALALFGIVFFRLWFLQVLSGNRYLAEANDNRVREVRLEAPRGDIVDRNSKQLVSNRPSWAIQIDAQRWPGEGAERRRLYRNLGRLLGKRSKSIDRSVKKQFLTLPFSNATVDKDVSFREVSTVLEHQEDYPGVTVSRIFERSYPRGALGAHLFGFVREIDQKELKGGKFEGAALGDRVGKDGLEREYDQYLRGRSGSTRVQVDALGRAKGGLLTTRDPVPGQQLRLTVDRRVQEVGERALATGKRLGGGTAGAFVAMDISNGEVLGLGSDPDFDPAIFTRPLSQAQANALLKGTNAPYANRAITSGYPAASTFKPITSIAALESGIYDQATTIMDAGKIKIADRYFSNAGEAQNGPVNLRKALTVSSDVYYYNFGRLANAKGGDIIQRWATRFGFGKATGIDLPGESKGLVPTPEWENSQPSYKLDGGQTVDPIWTVGDMANLSVGQGDLKVTPLQMAVAYAALGNGGNVVRPHLGMRVEDARGTIEQELEFGARRPIPGSAANRQAVLAGLRAAASAPGGTSTDVFSDFPEPIAGKTGTAEKPPGERDQSWYIALAPYPKPRYVVAVTIERGGFGAEAAAPAAKLILARLLNVSLDPKELESGSSRTR